MVLAIPWHRFRRLATGVTFLPIEMNVIECLLCAAVAEFELTISSGAVLLLTRQARPEVEPGVRTMS